MRFEGNSNCLVNVKFTFAQVMFGLHEAVDVELEWKLEIIKKHIKTNYRKKTHNQNCL